MPAKKSSGSSRRRHSRKTRQGRLVSPSPIPPARKSCSETVMQSTYHPPTIIFLVLLSLTAIPYSQRTTANTVAPPTDVSPTTWKGDYETRLYDANALGRPQPIPIYVRWLHSPKTGTSFANTLVRWGCPTSNGSFITPRKERPPDLEHPIAATHSWDWLFLNASGRAWLRVNCTPRLARSRRGRVRYALYMHKGLEKWEVRHAVGLFRMPLQRIYSNYLHLSRHYNESRAPRESLASFVRRTQFWGQQTKLLLGRHYRDTRIVTHDEALQAATMVRKMLFVGLTEQFQLSCRLFHAMFGGVPHRAQFENVRPGISRYREKTMRAAEFRYDEAVFDGWRDEADDVVYDAARERFWVDIRRFKEEIEKDGLGQVDVPPETPV